MRHLFIFTVWLAVAGGVLAAIFAPDIGLIHGGHAAAVGMALLGLAMMRHHRAAAEE